MQRIAIEIHDQIQQKKFILWALTSRNYYYISIIVYIHIKIAYAMEYTRYGFITDNNIQNY